MHADLEKFVNSGKIPADFASRLDRFSPGKYVIHGEWGVGKVAAWSLTKQVIKINFEQKENHILGLRLAFNQLTPLPEGHFLINCFDDPEGVRQQADKKETMLGFIRLVLSHNFSLREGIDEVLPMFPEDLEKFLVGRVIEASSWKNWWERARVAMRDDPGFRLPTKRGEAIALRASSSAAEALYEDYCAANTLESCVRILDLVRLDVLDGEYELVAKLVKEMEKDIERDRAEPQHVLELIIIRDEIMERFASCPEAKEKVQQAFSAEGITTPTTLSDKLSSISSEEIVRYIGELTAQRQRLVYECLPATMADSWVAYATNIFLFGGAKTIAPVADFIIAKGEKEQLFADIVNGIFRQSLSPDVLIWVFRERTNLTKEVFEKNKVALGSAILNAIERDSTEGGPNRALRLRNLLIDDKQLAPDLIQGLVEAEARPFAKSLYDSSVLADLDRNLILANMMKVHPGLQEVVLSRTKVKERQATFVSLRSYAIRKAEFNELVNVRIPQNKRDLEVTRAEGDLRENGGYQDAKATRAILMRRSEELSRALAQSSPTDFSDVDLSVTGMGTQVTFETKKGEQVIYTILGAWDSMPEERIISYSSRQGVKLSGHKVGDNLRLVIESGKPAVSLKVISIERPPAELIYADEDAE